MPLANSACCQDLRRPRLIAARRHAVSRLRDCGGLVVRRPLHPCGAQEFDSSVTRQPFPANTHGVTRPEPASLAQSADSEGSDGCPMQLVVIRSAPESPAQNSCADVLGCTTKGSNTHITDSREVHYPWHPWYGRQVTVRGGRHRRGTVVVSCTTDDEHGFPVLEVPLWMFDSGVCSRLKGAATARVDCRALRAVKVLLASVSRVEQEPVVQGQHHPVVLGGADAKESEIKRNSVAVIPAAPPESRGTPGSSSEDPAPAGANATRVRRQGLGGRSRPGGEP